MNTFLKNYFSTILLLGSVVIGGIAGIIFGEKTAILQPIGQIFLNTMFVIIVPLVFFSIASAVVSKGETQQRIGKILIVTLVVFIITAILSALLGYIALHVYNPFQNIDISNFLAQKQNVETSELLSPAEMFVKILTVSDFMLLLSRNNMIPLIIFSLIFGFATAASGEKGRLMAQFLESGSHVMMQFVHYVMKFAPIGLGCYFAYTIGEVGPDILSGYVSSFVMYLFLSLIHFFMFNSFYTYLAGGKLAFTLFWRHVTQPALTAVATTSSAACIPINIEAANHMKIPHDIANTVLPLGANTHKDGSVLGGILKIAFLFALSQNNVLDVSNMFAVVGTALLVGVVIGSIPGGGLTAEITICTILGFPLELVPLIAIISTIIDVPATLLNSTGNLACTMMVARIIDGKNWLHKTMTPYIS